MTITRPPNLFQGPPGGWTPESLPALWRLLTKQDAAYQEARGPLWQDGVYRDATVLAELKSEIRFLATVISDLAEALQEDAEEVVFDLDDGLGEPWASVEDGGPTT